MIAQNLCRKRMAPNPPTALANRRAHALSLNRIGKPVAASPRNDVNKMAWRYLCASVKRTKYFSLPSAFGCSAGSTTVSSVMFFLCHRPAFAPLHLRANEPQQRVQRKETERAPQQHIHKQPHVIQRRIQLAVVRIRMRLVLDEARVGVRMAPSAGLHQVRL